MYENLEIYPRERDNDYGSPTTYYRPLEDITVYELALLTPVLIAANTGHNWLEYLQTLPQGAKRHFKWEV